jgi:predicted RNA-binding protein YlxR (DUF448 family)
LTASISTIDPNTPAGEPVRTCIVTRARQPESRLVRFVRGVDGRVVADLKRALPGRGAWVLRSRDVIGRAIAQKAFSRAFRNESKADQGLAAEVETALETNALVALRRAIQPGEVKSAENYGNAGTVLAEIVRQEEAEKNGETVVRIISIFPGEVSNNNRAIIMLSAHEMSLAFGSSPVLKAFVLDGRFGRAFLNAANLLRDYRSPATNIVAKQTKLPDTRRGIPQDMD